METITLTQLKENFNIVLEISINKKYTIENEINAITDYINSIPNYKLFRKPGNPDFKNKNNKIFKIKISDLSRSLFNDAFNNYMQVGKHTIERFHSDTDEMFEYKEKVINQAYELADYYKWLNKLLTAPQKEEKKSDALNHKERMLALYYLGLDMRKFGNNLQAAKILSKIIGFDESNTKKFLTYFDGKECEVKKEPNLTKMLELFEHPDFKEIHNAVKKDLEK